jgi:DnaJ homolog subfamily C member 13
VFALVRNPDDEQSFTIEFVHSGVRHYRATERDALLATLLDGVRSSGNRDIHVRSNQTNRGWRFTPLWQAPDEEVCDRSCTV